jgi:hypothetical protein
VMISWLNSTINTNLGNKRSNSLSENGGELVPAVVGGVGQSCDLTVHPRGTTQTGAGVGLHLGGVKGSRGAGILNVRLGSCRAVIP